MFGYRAFGWKLDRRYAHWIAEDVRSGRSLRWRWLTCTVVILGTQVLVSAGFAVRDGSWWRLIGPMIGAPLGVVLGTFLVRRQNVEQRVSKALRYQGLLPSGDPDPRPSWGGRLDNYAIAAMQLAAIALVGAGAGLLPRSAIPIPEGRCFEPSGAKVGAIEAELRPGVRVDSLRGYRSGTTFVIAGVVDKATTATWQGFTIIGDGVYSLDESAKRLTPALGGRFVSVETSDIDDVAEIRREAIACARSAEADRHREPSAFVASPSPDVPLGVLRLRDGSATTDVVGASAQCSNGQATLANGGDGKVIFIATPPRLSVTIQLPATSPASYVGRTADIRDGVVILEGVLEANLPAQSPTVSISGRVPCVSTS